MSPPRANGRIFNNPPPPLQLSKLKSGTTAANFLNERRHEDVTSSRESLLSNDIWNPSLWQKELYARARAASQATHNWQPTSKNCVFEKAIPVCVYMLDLLVCSACVYVTVYEQNLSDRNKIKYRKKKKRWDTSSMLIVHSQPCMRCLILVFPPLSFPNRGCFVGSPLPSCIFISQKNKKARGVGTNYPSRASQEWSFVSCSLHKRRLCEARTFVVFKIFPMSRAVLVNVEFRSKSRYRIASVR